MSRNINSTLSSNISSTPSQYTSSTGKYNSKGAWTAGIYRRVPSFLTESANSSMNDSDRILALAHRVAAISQLEVLENAERLRRSRDEQGETFKKFLAAEASYSVLSGLKPLRKTVGFSIAKRATQQEFLGAALGGQERKTTWLSFVLIEEQERARRIVDQGENLKRVLAGKTSALFMLGYPRVTLHSFGYIDDIDFLIEDASSGLAQSLENGMETIVDSAKSFGNLAIRAANFFGAKAIEGAHILAPKAQAAGEIALVKAMEGAVIAGELAKEGAQYAGAKALEGAAIAGDLAQEGAHIAGAKAIEGAAFAKEGAQIAGAKAIEGAKILTAQAQDLASDLWNGYLYTLSWSDLANLEEHERQWRMASLNSLDRFMIAMNVSSLFKDHIRTNDAAFYQPKRHYGTQVLEEFERIRRLLEFKSDKTARKNARLSAMLIKAHVNRAKNNQRYDNWTAAQAGSQTMSQAQIAPAQRSAPVMPAAQAAAVVLPTAARMSVMTPSGALVPALTSVPVATVVTAPVTSVIAPVTAAKAVTWGPTTRSQWAYIPSAQVGFTSYGSYKPSTTWKPTPAAQILQQSAPQQQAFAPKQSQVTQVQQTTTTTSFTAAM